jgi:hypothetical protein
MPQDQKQTLRPKYQYVVTIEQDAIGYIGSTDFGSVEDWRRLLEMKLKTSTLGDNVTDVRILSIH